MIVSAPTALGVARTKSKDRKEREHLMVRPKPQRKCQVLPEIRRIRQLEKSRTSPTHAEKARTSPTHGLRKVYTCVTSRTARMTAERRARQRDASERRGELGGQHRDSGNVLLLARARSQHGYVVVGSSTAGRSLQPRPTGPGSTDATPARRPPVR